MAIIDEYLSNIQSATYGEEVRQSIHDAIAAINDEEGTLAQERVDQAVENALSDVTDELGSLKSDLDTYGIIDFDKGLRKETQTVAGVTFTYNNKQYTFSGTSTGTAAYNLIHENTLSNFYVDKPFHLVFNSTDENVYLQIYRYIGTTLSLYMNLSNVEDIWVSLPTDTTGLLIRARVTNGSTVNGTLTVAIKGTYTQDEMLKISEDLESANTELVKKLGYVKVLTSDDDIDDYQDTGAYLWLGSNHPSNVPSAENTAIMTIVHAYHAKGFVLQLIHTVGGKLYQRLCGSESFGWYPWYEISANQGSGDTIIENTYNISTNPTITTDTNGWLRAVDTDTSDETNKTDMSGPIMSMLNDTGYCHLGEGIFYVSGNIDMPEGSTLCGCGKKSVIRLLQTTTSGYCVKIGKYCTIKDLSLEGARSFVVPTEKGTRNGIDFMANYDSSPSVTTEHCMIDNIWLKYFSGAGIYCHNTSINYAKGVYVTNAFIYACYAGIDIDYYSEFNKFVNICTAWCKFGCINNGGNNVFTSCTFHATSVGFFIDGSQPNSAHGTITGCTFCHIGSNQGKAILIENSINGFIIDSCQIWYNSIELLNSKGVVFNGCELGRGTTGAGATISVTGGGTVLFIGCMFMNDVSYAPDITITNNNNVKFANCYGSESGNAITVERTT